MPSQSNPTKCQDSLESPAHHGAIGFVTANGQQREIVVQKVAARQHNES